MPEKKRGVSNVSRRTVLTAGAAITSQLVLPVSAGAEQKPSVVSRSRSMDLERFVADCIEANQEREAQAAVLEVLARAVSDPKAVLAAVGDPAKAGIAPLHKSATLTIFTAAWTPQMNLMPHNHLMWANIGIYTGREDNILWKDGPDGIEGNEAKCLFERDAASLPVDAIHSVTNPLLRFTGGIHIYGGDFFGTTRSQWDPETMEEQPSDGNVIRGMFDRENKRLNIG